METIYQFIAFLLVGLIAGWLAGKITKGEGFGIRKNLLLGIIGSFLGGFVFWFLGFSSNSFIASVITSTIGALLLIYLVKRMRS